MKIYVPTLLLIWSVACLPTTYAQTGIITTIAGNGTAGALGDRGAATAAQLSYPNGVATDATGNIYIAESAGNRIRKIDASGIITTFAGTGSPFSSGDNGPATAAGVGGPSSIVIDGAGNVYFDDEFARSIRKVDASGIIRTIAGTPGGGVYNGDGHPATATTFGGDIFTAIDGIGNIYVADGIGNRIVKFNPATGGIVATIAGTGVAGFSGDGFSAATAMIYAPGGMVIDAAGNVYFSDEGNNRVRKISASGIITTIAGTGVAGFGGNGGPATAATVTEAIELVFDTAGNLYIPNNGASIRRIDAAGIITLYAGNDTVGYSGDGGLATNAKLYNPAGIAYSSGTIYFSDALNNRIRKVKGLDYHAPSFQYGDNQNYYVCENRTDTSLGALLAITDVDPGQTETWSVISPAMHGTVVASATMPTTGSLLTPVGISYTPTTGYSGPDSFKVQVNDGVASDTITIHVTVNSNTVGSCNVGVNSIVNNELKVFPNPATDELNITGVQQSTNYRLLSFTGMTIQQGTLQPGNNTLPMQQFPAGIYILELSGEDGNRKMMRLIKE